MKLIAEQLVYARVEPVLSPRRTAGFQTVYHTPSLAPATVAEIQKLVGNFSYQGDPRDLADSLQRLQFFRLNDGRFVLTKAVPAFHKQYIDRAGRPGAFICHCLILAADQFRAIGNNPFVVFEGWDGFVTDPEDLHERFGDAVPSDAPLPITLGSLPPIELGWPNEEVRQLRKAALLAKSMLASGRSITFVGDYDATAEVLRAIFELTPEETRPDCTFSTHADGCEVPQHIFWALGISRRQRESYAEIDVNEQRVSRLPEGGLGGSLSMFARWLDLALETQAIDAVLAKAGVMQTLCDALDDKQPLGSIDEAWNGDATAEFCTIFARELLARLVDRVGAFLAEPLAKQVAEWWFARLPQDDLLRVTLSSVGLRLQEVAEWSFWFVEDRFRRRSSREFTRREWATLREFARRAKHGGLLFLASVANPLPILGWKRQRDRQEALALLDQAGIDDLLAAFKSFFAPEDFLCPAATEQLLKDAAERKLPDESLFALLEAVVKQDTPFVTPERIIERIAAFPRPWTARLLSLCKTRESVDERLREALARAASADKTPTSWWEPIVWPFRVL